MADEKKSIFDLADKFGVNSPFGNDWVDEEFTTNQNEGAKITNAYVVKNPIRQAVLEDLNKRENRKYFNIIPVAVIVSIEGYTDKVEVELDGKKQTAYKKMPLTGKTYEALFDVTIPVPYRVKDFIFKISVTDVYTKKISDTRNISVTVDLDGGVKSKGFLINSGLSFEELQKAGELPPEDIKKYREFITDLTSDEKIIWYYELQKHAPYHSQRDNENPNADVMCNLTTLAMNLEFLGVSCPDKNIQFEDWLEEKRVEKKYPARTDPNSWMKLAKDLGVKSEQISIWTKKSNTEDEIRQIVFDKIEPYISKGNSVSLSAFTIASTKGHIVRLQSVNNDGIIVDDPFGRVNNFQERENGGSGYKGSRNSKDNIDIFGKDNLWRWSDIKICTIKYIVVFYKLEK